MIDFLKSGDWYMAREFLMRGEPPLIVQLLILNTIILIVWIFRRARGAGAMRQTTANTIQVMLILANCVLLLNADYGYFEYQWTRFLDMLA